MAAAFLLALPPRPCDAAVRVTSGPFTVVHSGARDKAARLLLEAAGRDVGALEKDFGRGFDLPVTVFLVDRSEGGDPAAPPGMPAWASGLASPGERTIWLKTASALKGAPSDILATLAHELTHVYLDWRTGGRPLPAWLEEGLAMRAAGEYGFTDRLALTLSALGPERDVLGRLEGRFPEAEGEARAAYAAAYDFTGHVLGLGGSYNLRRLFDLVGRGHDFPEAFALAFGRGLAGTEEEWAGSLTSASRWTAFIAGGSSFWAFVSLLFLLVYWRKRVVSRRRLSSMEMEEFEEETGVEHPGRWPSRERRKNRFLSLE